MHPHTETPWLMITGGDVVLAGGDVVPEGTVLIRNGVIEDVLEKPPASLLLEQEDVSILDASDHWVTPGLIDQHLHGAFGVDFNQSSMEDLHGLLRRLPQCGITAILPTLISAPKLDMIMALANLEEVIQTSRRDQARILGIHLEGPFLNPKHRGAHSAEDLLRPSINNLEGLLSPSIKRVTIAPELDTGLETIHHLVRQDILCSMGHSDADYETAVQAIHSGVHCVTHLYNAMRHIEHRDPGIAVASLLQDDVFVELITDGRHIAPEMIHLTLKAKPFERCIVISDCNALTGMGPGSTMRFGKQAVTVHPEGALNEEGRLAGSTMLIHDCIRNLVEWGLLSFPDAVQLATANPSAYLNTSDLFGQLLPGTMADLVLWRKSDLSIQGVFLSGEPIALMEETPFSLKP